MNKKPKKVIDVIFDSVQQCSEFVKKAGIEPEIIKKIGEFHMTCADCGSGL